MMRDLITATSGSGFLMLEAFGAISGETGSIMELLKIMMVVVIVVTSIIGTLAADKDGDGVPDIYMQIARLFCPGKGKATPKSSPYPPKPGPTDKEND